MNSSKVLSTTLTTLAVGFTLMASSIPASAAGEGGHIPMHPRVNEVNHRMENQRDRIQQGIKNGTLGPAELARLRSERMGLREEIHTMRAADNGHLTRADDLALNQQLNHDSRQIFRFKHNQ